MGERLRHHERKNRWLTWLFSVIAVAMLASACSPLTVDANGGESVSEPTRIVETSEASGVETAIGVLGNGELVYGEPLVGPNVPIPIESPLCNSPEKMVDVPLCVKLARVYQTLPIESALAEWAVTHTFIVRDSEVGRACAIVGANGCAKDDKGIVLSESAIDSRTNDLTPQNLYVPLHEFTHVLVNMHKSEAPTTVYDEGGSCAVINDVEMAVVCGPSQKDETQTECISVSTSELFETSAAFAVTAGVFPDQCGENATNPLSMCGGYNGFELDGPNPIGNEEYLIPRYELRQSFASVIRNRDMLPAVVAALEGTDTLRVWQMLFEMFGWGGEITPNSVRYAGNAALSLRTYTHVFTNQGYLEEVVVASEYATASEMCLRLQTNGK